MDKKLFFEMVESIVQDTSEEVIILMWDREGVQNMLGKEITKEKWEEIVHHMDFEYDGWDDIHKIIGEEINEQI